MRYQPGFPKTMVHPSYAPAKLGTGDRDGLPARFPPIEVHNADQEEQYRARGYAVPGERPTATIFGYHEYPKMLHHPGHKPAVPDETIAERKESGEIVKTVVKGKPEEFAPVIVRNAHDEQEWRAKGWGDRAKPNPEAFATAKSSPYVAGRQHNEWPKWVDGKLLQDPEAPPSGPAQYPKWTHGVIVQTESEHRQRFPEDFMGTAALEVASGNDALTAANEEIERLKRELAAAKQPKRPGRPRKIQAVA